MKTNRKIKGFTIVELVIVIAVIGILSAILIPTFSNLIESSKLANDQAIVTNANKALAIEEVYSGDPNDAIEIRKIIKERGVKLVNKSKGNYFWYDLEKQEVVLAGLNDDGSIKLATTEASLGGAITVHAKGVEGNENKGKLTEATSPEIFMNGYLLLSEKSADGFADAIYTLRNPEGKESITKALETLKEIKNNEGAKKVAEKISTFMRTTAVMTEGGILSVGTNNNVNRVIVSEEMSKITNQALTGLSEYKNVIVVDFHSGVVAMEEEAITSAKANDFKPYLVYSNNELKAIGKTEGIAKLISKDERSDHIATLYIREVIKDSEGNLTVGNATDSYDISFEDFTLNCEFGYQYKAGTSSISYDFVGYSLYQDGTNAFELGEFTYTLSDAEKYLIKNGELDIYCVYDKAVSDFSVGAEYYSSKTLTYMLANNYFKDSGETIIVATTTATLDASLIGEESATLTIPSGVTLHVPYLVSGANSSMIDDMATHVKNNEDAIVVKNYTALDKENVVGHRKLTIAEGVTVQNQGLIYVDAQLYRSTQTPMAVQCYITEACGVLEVEGVIESTGTIKAYGVIRGGGEIIANEGVVNEMFIVLDWNGGTNATAAINTNATPFNNWKVDNIRVSLTLCYGVEYTAFGSIYVEGNNSINFTLVDTDTASTTPLFKMQSGAKVQKTYDEGVNLSILEGTVLDGKKTVDITISSITKTVDFQKVALPISNFDVTIKSGAALTLSNNLYKVLPGSDVVVEEGGTLDINTTVAFYDSYDLKLIQAYKVGTILDGTAVYDSITACTYSADGKAMSVSYDYYARKLLFGSYEKKSSGKAGCSVPTYTYSSEAKLKVNGTLNLGANAVFTGDIISDIGGAIINVNENSKFTNSTTVNDVDGTAVTVHAFLEGVAFRTSTAVTLLTGHWQPAYAQGVDTTGNFVKSGSTDFVQIPTGAATYTFNGSVWG